MPIAINKKIPAISAINQDNETISISDYLGSWVVLYFYPTDDTETCTKEACNFRDNMELLTNIGAVVIGVSPDGAKSHTKFIKKYNLNFNLICDEKLKIIKKFNLWHEKTLFGHKYMGVVRTTFLIDPKGKVQKIYNNVRVNGHTEQIIKDIESFKKTIKISK